MTTHLRAAAPYAAALAMLLLAGIAPAARAQAATAVDPAFAATTLGLSAYGETKAPPDMATIDLGVDTTAVTAAEAMRANAARMAKVVEALKAAGIAERDLQTADLSLSPQYADDDKRPPRVTGYQASNHLSVTVRDLTRLGPVADAVVGAGATNIGQINLGLADPLAAENKSRLAAVKALQDKAALYAQATGYRVGRLVNLVEGGGYAPSPRPMAMAKMMVASAPATSVQAGELNVRVEVSGVFELSR